MELSVTQRNHPEPSEGSWGTGSQIPQVSWVLLTVGKAVCSISFPVFRSLGESNSRAGKPCHGHVIRNFNTQLTKFCFPSDCWIIQAVRDLRRPCSKQNHPWGQAWSFIPMPPRLLKAFEARGCTTSPGNLFPAWLSSWWKSFSCYWAGTSLGFACYLLSSHHAPLFYFSSLLSCHTFLAICLTF